MTFRSVSSITIAAGVGRWLLWTTSTPGGVVSAARTTSDTRKQRATATRTAHVDRGAKAPEPHDTYGLLTPLIRAMISQKSCALLSGVTCRDSAVASIC